MAEGGTGSEPRRDDLVRDPLTDFECALKLPTRAECERGMSMMLGWVPFTESGMVNTAFAALVAARNPSLTRQQYFSLVHGPNGRRVEPPFADDARVGSGHDERARCSCGDGSAEEDRGAVLRCPVHGIGSQEVGSGHDEQAEARGHGFATDAEFRAWCEAGSPSDWGCKDESAATREERKRVPAWQRGYEEGRQEAVAAVVEALRADDVPTAFKGAFGNAADWIENHPRFGSSVSGGE
jgi:hypothetical protein